MYPFTLFLSFGGGFKLAILDKGLFRKQKLAHHGCGIAGRVTVERDGFSLGDDEVGRVLQDDRGRVGLRVRVLGMDGQQVRVAEVI